MWFWLIFTHTQKNEYNVPMKTNTIWILQWQYNKRGNSFFLVTCYLFTVFLLSLWTFALICFHFLLLKMLAWKDLAERFCVYWEERKKPKKKMKHNRSNKETTPTTKKEKIPTMRPHWFNNCQYRANTRRK